MNAVEITYRYGTHDASERTRPTDPEAARLRLNTGNAAFASLLDGQTDGGSVRRRVVDVDVEDLGMMDGEPGIPRHRPFAAVLGCSDARVPVELVFGEGPNDLFVVRVAGNGLGGDVLGSLKYAMDHLKTIRLAVVLGHSGCGALTAAVDLFMRPAEYLSLATSHALRGLLDRQLIVVQACSRQLVRKFGADVTERPGYRSALIETAIASNAALSAYTIQQEISRVNPDGPRAVFGVYLLRTREVWAPTAADSGSVGLAYPPNDEASFLAFGEAMVASERIVSLLP